MNELGSSQIDDVSDDEHWINQTLAGDTEAFGQLVTKYQNRLFNSLVYFLRDPTEAEDVAQEAFVSAFTRLCAFRQDSSFYTWLYRIAFNASSSRRRKLRATVSLETAMDGAKNQTDPTVPTPSARLELEEQTSALHQAMERLNKEHRAILVMRELEGMNYEDIAQVLDLPKGTVRSRLHRARCQLKDEMQASHHEPSLE